MGPKKYFRWWGLCALIGVGCGGQADPGRAGTQPAPSCDGYAVGQLLEADQPCSQIGKRCAFDVDGVPAAVDPDAALKCECLDPYPLTYHCGPRVWP